MHANRNNRHINILNNNRIIIFIVIISTLLLISNKAIALSPNPFPTTGYNYPIDYLQELNAEINYQQYVTETDTKVILGKQTSLPDETVTYNLILIPETVDVTLHAIPNSYPYFRLTNNTSNSKAAFMWGFNPANEITRRNQFNVDANGILDITYSHSESAIDSITANITLDSTLNGYQPSNVFPQSDYALVNSTNVGICETDSTLSVTNTNCIIPEPPQETPITFEQKIAVVISFTVVAIIAYQFRFRG